MKVSLMRSMIAIVDTRSASHGRGAYLLEIHEKRSQVDAENDPRPIPAITRWDFFEENVQAFSGRM